MYNINSLDVSQNRVHATMLWHVVGGICTGILKLVCSAKWLQEPLEGHISSEIYEFFLSMRNPLRLKGQAASLT